MNKKISIMLSVIFMFLAFYPSIPEPMKPWAAGLSVLFLSIFIILDDFNK